MVIGPISFAEFLKALYLDLCNFEDDNTLFSHDSNLPLILNKLEYDMCNFLNWFKINLLKANPGKF